MQGMPPVGEWTWERLSHDHNWASGLGFGNGRALARLGAIIANSGMLDGVRYLSEAMAREVRTEQAFGEEPLFGSLRLGLFVTLDQPAFRLPSPTSCYWGGGGGSLCVMDPRTGFSFGYAMNNFIMGGLGEGARIERFWAALSGILASLPDAPTWQG
jgi:CubicO group peptidase (beta-lactamase class C family)